MCKLDNVASAKGPMPIDFYHSYTDEPHRTRRKLILEKHPEIESLFGTDIRPVPFVILIAFSQLFLAYLQQNWSIGIFLLVAWSYGGTASHALSLMTHELSHNLIFKSKMLNEWFGIFCNIGMGVPSSTMFKRYHMEHHQFQGDVYRDVDIPTQWEGKFFRSTFMKGIWLFCQPLFYAFRPMIMRPKPARTLDICNTVVIILSNSIIVYFFGYRAVIYLISSTVLGMGWHPVAGHFVAEHYVFTDNVETYSYYGLLNLVCWNVGYHNEHHDFPRVPGWKLPLVKALAPEFYDHLPNHPSWIMVLWNFVTDPSIGPYCRVQRGFEKGKCFTANDIDEVRGGVVLSDEKDVVKNSISAKKSD